MSFKKCSRCGANLDPKETCNCEFIQDDDSAEENDQDENETEKKRATRPSDNPHSYFNTGEGQNQEFRMGEEEMSYSKQKKFDRALCRFINSAEQLFVSVSADNEIVISDHYLVLKMPLAMITVEVKAEVYKRMEVIPAPGIIKTHSKSYGIRQANSLDPNKYDSKDFKYMYHFTDLINKAIADQGSGAHVYYHNFDKTYSYKMIQSKYVNLMQNLQVRTHIAHSNEIGIMGLILFRSEFINVFIAPLRCNSSAGFLKGVEA